MDLLCFVGLEECASLFEGESISVDLEFVSARVFRNGNNMADSMAMLAEGLDDEIDIYHGRESTAAGSAHIGQTELDFE
jgi:hypothetical protein